MTDVPAGLPTRESEALEWIEAAVMLLVKDGLDVRLTGRRCPGAQRVVGELDELHWRAEHTFLMPKGGTVDGFEARTPEGALVAENPLEPEAFDFGAGSYRLYLELDFRLIPLGSGR